MQRTGLILLKSAIAVLSVMPFGFLYVLSDVLSFFFARVIKYRYPVIIKNLHTSFPEKNSAEIRQLAGKFYRHFSDILLESLKGLTLSKEELQRKFVFTNPEIFDTLFQQNQSAILLGSHYGNWEWGVLSFPLAVRHRVIGIYKPLKNRKLDTYLNNRRQQWGLHLFSMKQAGRAIAQNRHRPCIYVLIADQTPSNIRDAHWVDFLQQDTPFLNGPGKLAKRTGFPVFVFEICRMKRGFYEVSFKQLSPDRSEQNEVEITRRFAKHLEEQIQHAPENWLWSHRRWKRQRAQL